MNSESIFPWALRGDLKPVLKFFEQAPPDGLTSEESELRDRYLRRFGFASEGDSNSSSFADQVLLAHRNYWRESLTGFTAAPNREAHWYMRLVPVAKSRGWQAPEFSEAAVEDLTKFLTDTLRVDGLYCQLGCTLPLRDLFLWRRQEVRRFPIDLGDVSVEVPVTMMYEFLSVGWLGYATFDRQYPGGWSTPEMLYCFGADYDFQSEKFRVSYLAHEGRHFSDQNRFPKLKSADLEYRAKLTELCLAEETRESLYRDFCAEAADDAESPHAWASFHIAQRLAGASDVRLGARAALDEHTRELLRLGAETVTGTL